MNDADSQGGAKKRVLLVDDDEHLLVTVGDFLKFSGFEVMSASSGEDALSRLAGVKPDIIILDIGMPGIGGLGFLRHIATQGGRPEYPVLVLTARSAMKGFFESFEADGFLEKPCDPAELVRKAREIISAREAERLRVQRVHQRTVLLGENEAEVSEAVTGLLADAGYTVHVAEFGPDVLEKAVVQQPDIIVMKRLLFRMNGDVVATLLHDMPTTHAIPIVLYDGSDMTEAEEYQCIRASPQVRHVLRTDQPRELFRVITEIIKPS